MVRQEQRKIWQEIKEIWKNSFHGEIINFQISKLINELKGKMNQFEKEAIESDIIKIKSSWNQYKGEVSHFEKNSISKDLLKISKLLKKWLQKLKTK